MKSAFAGWNEGIAKGIIFMIASTALVTVGLFLPRLISSDADPVQVSFLRYIGGSLCLAVIHLLCFSRTRAAVFNRIDHTGKAWHIVRAVVGFGTLTMTIVAARLLPIGNVQAILACNGLFVLAWLATRGIEPLRKSVVAGTVLCVSGALLSSSVKLSSYSLLGYAAALTASACWAAEIIIFRHAILRSPGNVSLLFINLVGVVLLVIPGTLRWRHIGGLELCALLSVGILLVASQATLIKALERIPLSFTIPFRYFNVPIALGLGVIFLRQVPSIEAIAGALMIMIGGTMLNLHLSFNKT